MRYKVRTIAYFLLIYQNHQWLHPTRTDKFRFLKIHIFATCEAIFSKFQVLKFHDKPSLIDHYDNDISLPPRSLLGDEDNNKREKN